MSLSLCYVQLPRASALSCVIGRPAACRPQRAHRHARGPGTAPGPAGPRGHRSESRPPFWLRFTQPRLDECFAFDNSCSRHVCIGSSTSAELCSPKASWVMHTHSTVLPAIFVAAGHFRRRRPFSSPPSFARDVSGCFTCLSSSSRGSHPRASRRGRARRVRRADTRTRPTCPFACADAGMPR